MNPAFWEDFADIDIIHVDNKFYYSVLNMYYFSSILLLYSYNL
jgi:hypothetical protein